MKKLTLCTATLLMLLAFNGSPIKATELPVPAKTAASVDRNLLLNRLDEISAMNKAGMPSSEKKLLRKEMRHAKRQVSQSGGGVYVSVGALIIILLLLIILL